ncbi:MAG: CotH kinase family protein [Flavobacteriales bacterium]
MGDTLELPHPYCNGGSWTMQVHDTSTYQFKKLCLMAPDLLVFELQLNNKTLIKCESNTTWPSSFNVDSIAIYPCDSMLRPYVIEPMQFKAAWQKGQNTFSLRIKGKNIKGFDAGNFALYGNVEGDAINKHSPTFSSSFYHDPKLPTIIINSENYSIPNEPKVKATFSLTCNDEENCEAFTRDVRIEVRGFSSTSFDKKQYTFTIAGDSTKKEKITPLGLNPSRRWILQGPYVDPSLIRNALVYSLWKEMGYWAPQSRYVELILNGNYQGVYLIMEKIEVNKSRLNLAIDTSSANAFLVQLNRRKENDDIIQVNEHFFILSDLPDLKKTEAYRLQTKSRLEKFCRDLEDPMAHQESIDIRSLADFILVQEMVKNVDAYKVSTWLYKDDILKDDRIHFGPVWDFDLSVGSSNILRGDSPESWIYPTDKSIPDFFANQFENPAFMAFMSSRYKELRSSIWSQQTLHHKIDSLVNCIGKEAIDRNFLRFPVLGQKTLNTYHNVPPTHQEEIAKMKDWLNLRLIWMDKYFGVQTSASGSQ